ncbi:MAG TPA: hypothetical protein VHW65_09530, partial [Gemmatimonadales bacterium]|nr:hypothetical protein [Gemmatimonadales bacterium]
GQSLGTTLTTGSGLFLLTVPAEDRYLYRVAAIGYTPKPLTAIEVGPDGLVLGDIALVHAVMRLPDLLAVGRNQYCGKKSMSDDIFGRLLESAHTALDIIDRTIESHRLSFVVEAVHSKMIYGSAYNQQIADTVYESLSQWPVESIDMDTLQAVGFARLVYRDGARIREYYGPDPRVLFSDWFLDSHCFSLGKVKKGSDTLHVLFVPQRTTKLVDISGDLLLDAHDLSLLSLTYQHTNLPKYMPKNAAGGNMQFEHLSSGLWITMSWAIWGPIDAINYYNGKTQVGGMSERRGLVLKAVPTDTAKKPTAH